MVVSATALTRTISDSSDTLYTFIRNSNGKCWEATGVNIQTAINDLGASGGTVWLPAGTIDLTTHLILNNHIALVGAGMYSTVLRLVNDDSYGNILIDNVNNVSITDMTIDGNNRAVSSVNGIEIKDSRDFLLQNLYVYDCGAHGIVLFDDVSHGFFNNIHIVKVATYHGIGATGDYLSFNNIQVSETEGYGINFHAIRNCTINNIIIYDCEMGIKVFGENGIDCWDNTINNVRILNINKDYLGLYISNSHQSSFNNIIVNNSLGGFRIENSDYINANNIYVEDSANIGVYIKSSHNVNINNVISRNAGTYGFSISSSNNCSCSHIQAINCGTSNYLADSQDFIITSSSFENSGNYGLSLVRNSRFKITDCDFLNNAYDGIDSTTGACNNYIITGCYFMGNMQAIDCHANDDYIIITLNTCISDPIDDHYTSKGYVTNNIGDDI
jgi:hypothetical protein